LRGKVADVLRNEGFGGIARRLMRPR
jgi:hypothetical protein